MNIQKETNQIYTSNIHVRDLGILISEDLKFHAQIDQACKRAHAEINRIRRSFVSRSPDFIAEMFKLYVRPHLEYAVEVWNPRCRGDVMKIEKVQNKMTKLIPHGHMLSQQQRNAKLGLSSHEDRRLRGDLINIYKNIENQYLFSLRNNPRLRGNSRTINVPLSNCLIKKHSFSARAINEWNTLPELVVSSQNINVFKRNLDKYMFPIQITNIFLIMCCIFVLNDMIPLPEVVVSRRISFF